MNFTNKYEIAGVVVGTPDLAYVGGKLKCSFLVITEYAYRKAGQAVIEKTYHKCTAWECPTADAEKLRRLKAGCKVHVTGRMRNIAYSRGDEQVKENVLQAMKLTILRQGETLLCEKTL